MKKVTATNLRQNIYRILDEVVEQGQVVEVERKGQIIRIVSPQTKGRLGRLKRRKITRVGPEDLVHCNWEKMWKPRSL